MLELTRAEHPPLAHCVHLCAMAGLNSLEAVKCKMQALQQQADEVEDRTQGLQRAALARCGRAQLLPPHRKQAKFLACCCQLCPGFQVKSSPARGAESGLTGSLGLSHHQHPPRGRDSRSWYLGKESQSHQNAPSSEPPPAPTWPSQSLCFTVGTQPNLGSLGWATGGLG